MSGIIPAPLRQESLTGDCPNICSKWPGSAQCLSWLGSMLSNPPGAAAWGCAEVPPTEYDGLYHCWRQILDCRVVPVGQCLKLLLDDFRPVSGRRAIALLDFSYLCIWCRGTGLKPVKALETHPLTLARTAGSLPIPRSSPRQVLRPKTSGQYACA